MIDRKFGEEELSSEDLTDRFRDRTLEEGDGQYVMQLRHTEEALEKEREALEKDKLQLDRWPWFRSEMYRVSGIRHSW